MRINDNTKEDNFIKQVVVVIVVMGLLLCCLYTLHDMQTAEGIGLFFALKAGAQNRIYFDILVDMYGIGCLILLSGLPCWLLKWKKWESYCRGYIAYLSVVPSVSLSGLLHMFQCEIVFLWDGNIRDEVLKWFLDSVESLKIWFPLLVLLYAILQSTTGEKGSCSKLLGKWQKIVWAIMGGILVLSLLVPATRHLMNYLMGYLGVILAFDCWENILQNNKKLEKWSWILFLLLLLRGIYRIVILVSLV